MSAQMEWVLKLIIDKRLGIRKHAFYNTKKSRREKLHAWNFAFRYYTPRWQTQIRHAAVVVKSDLDHCLAKPGRCLLRCSTTKVDQTIAGSCLRVIPNVRFSPRMDSICI